MSVNTTRPSSFGAPAPSNNAGGSAGLAIIQIVVLLSFPILMQSPDGERGLIALIAATLLIGVVSQTPSLGVPLTLFYVAIMSGLRRWLIPLFGYNANDPFILVTPVLVILNFVTLLIQRRVPRDSTLSRLLMWFVIIMGVEAVNPLQGGLAVGLGGLLLITVPVLWYYLARVTVTPKLVSQLFRLALIISVLCTLYAMYQQFVGLLPSEIEYVRITKYSQIMSANTARVFSTLSGFQEYSILVSLGAVIAFAQVLSKNRPAIFVFIFLLAAAILSSSRGVLVSVLATCVVLWAVQGTSLKSWWPRLVVAAIVGVGGLFWSLKQVKDSNVLQGNTSASELVGHQTELLNPFEKKFTGGGHATSQLSGIVSGFTHPFGLGTGSVTLAAYKFRSSDDTAGASSEGDIGNAFIAFGFVGGGLFLYLLYTVYLNAFRNWHYFRDLNSLCCLAIVLATFEQWLSGGNYIVALLVWFSIGYIDRSAIDRMAQTNLLAPPGRKLARTRRIRSARVTDDGSSGNNNSSAQPA